ncbi:cobalamin B12-binding domain-containing protein [Mobilitalea sibirica]|uniref:Cobalamin B12-binding domain-containing protein n=1 Tax=Mobilitalea sibirica TaxID=1462919 RepID=A0A8J7HDH7_9FIRM|nr:cobalamin-dependent protein [Mobilitalea sibirica]MBH1940774.1 cobalamin B12-binding domain-containing protein [Mobilitalea sibirica]
MEQILREFEVYFEEEDKEKAVQYVLKKLQDKEIDVINLYSNVLTPLLNNMKCRMEDQSIRIWKEHVKTAIIRTIVECSYPYVIEKRDLINQPKRGNVTVLCPPDEYHDLGARMVADFFTICGYNAIFVGSATPYRDFYNAIPLIKPEVVAISVSNYYNLVSAKRMIDEIKKVVNYPLKIMVGGYAFHDDEISKLKTVGADYYAKTFTEILKLTEDEVSI